MKKMNIAVGEKNCLDNSGDEKQLVFTFRRQEFWKCIGLIISAVTYGKKLHKLWGETQLSVGNKSQTKLHRDVRGNTYLLELICDIYCTRYCYACH